MALNGPFGIFIDERTGTQELRRIQQSGGGNGTTTINTSGGIPVLGIQTATDPNTQVQAVQNRNLLVLIRYATDSNIILPALGDATVGSKITFVRTATAGIPTIVTQVGSDQVNGVSTADFTPYPMRSLQDSVTYMRVPNGWQRDQGTLAYPPIVATTSPIEVPVRPEGTQYIIAVVPGAGTTVELPQGVLCRPGYRVAVLNAGQEWIEVVPGGADTINAATTEFWIAPGGSAFLELAYVSGLSASSWISVEQEEAPRPVIQLNSPVTVPAFRGFGRYILTLEASNQQVNLPSVNDLRANASVLVENNGNDGPVLVLPDGVETINGQDRRSVLEKRSCLFVNNGVSWTAIDGGRYSAPGDSAANPAEIPAWVDSPFFFTVTNADNPHVVELPLLTGMQYGATVWIHNDSLTDATITPVGGNTINGAATATLGGGNTAIVAKASATDWRVIVGA